jgi:very-short-patch-repair endonuclease
VRSRLKPEILGHARDLREKATGAEMKLWWKLRALKPLGFRFRRQVPFRNYILDFAEHRSKLVIELDGSQHGLKENRLYDERRDTLLRSEGYRVLRFWNGEIEENIDGVVDAIIRAAPHPLKPALTRDLARPPHEGEVKKVPLPRTGVARPLFRKPAE